MINCKAKCLLITLLLVFFPVATIAGPFEYGKRWNNLNSITKDTYIEGAVDGIFEGYSVTATLLAPKEFSSNEISPLRRKVLDRLFLRNTRSAVQAVMDKLYQDPENNFIPYLEILLIARDVIEGKDFIQQLRAERKRTLETYQLNMDMQGK